MVYRLFAGVCLLMGAVTSIRAQPTDVSRILAPIVERSKVPGMVALVIEGDQVVMQGMAGVRRAGGTEKVTLSDKFHVGSCTKAMTATLCAMLVEEGKLSWDKTLAEAFPDLKARMNPAYQSVTLQQLLTHRGGMPADLNADGLWGRLWSFQGSATAARRALLEGVVTKAPTTPPGGEYVYSNAGFAIAGHMAERAANSPWEELMRKRLFVPLGMTGAGFGAPGTRAKVDQPRGHTPAGKVMEPGPGSDNPAAIGPAGTVHCTIGDWAKFVSLHVRGSQHNPQRKMKLLKAETFDKLHAPAEGAGQKYAMGWLVGERPWAGGPVLNHAGSNTMWYAVAWLGPKRDMAVLVCCNQGGDAAAKACDEAASGLIREFANLRK